MPVPPDPPGWGAHRAIAHTNHLLMIAVGGSWSTVALFATRPVWIAGLAIALPGLGLAATGVLGLCWTEKGTSSTDPDGPQSPS